MKDVNPVALRLFRLQPTKHIGDKYTRDVPCWRCDRLMDCGFVNIAGAWEKFPERIRNTGLDGTGLWWICTRCARELSLLW